jgi:hypothetical protein
MGLAPLPFAFSLMTRSGKVDYESLRRRDPAFVAAYEASLGLQVKKHSQDGQDGETG